MEPNAMPLFCIQWQPIHFRKIYADLCARSLFSFFFLSFSERSDHWEIRLDSVLRKLFSAPDTQMGVSKVAAAHFSHNETDPCFVVIT